MRIEPAADPKRDSHHAAGAEIGAHVRDIGVQAGAGRLPNPFAQAGRRIASHDQQFRGRFLTKDLRLDFVKQQPNRIEIRPPV